MTNIQKLTKNINSLTKRRDKVADDAKKTADRLEQLRADAAQAVVDGKDPDRILAAVSETETRLGAEQRALTELERTIANVQDELLSLERDGDIARADDHMGQFADALRTVKTLVDQIDLDALEAHPYDAQNLAGRHGDSQRASVAKSMRQAGGQVAGDVRSLRMTLYRTLKWLETVQP